MDVVILNGREYPLDNMVEEREEDYGHVEIVHEAWTSNRTTIFIGRLIDYSVDKQITIPFKEGDVDEFEDFVDSFDLEKYYKSSISHNTDSI